MFQIEMFQIKIFQIEFKDYNKYILSHFKQLTAKRKPGTVSIQFPAYVRL